MLLLLLPLLFWLRSRETRRATIRFSSVEIASQAGKSLRQRLTFLPILLRILSISFLVIALARPQKGLEQVRETNEGIAIEMVVDRSSSMGEEMIFDGVRTNRLEVVKKVFEDFILGDDDKLEGRPNDLIGLISFARYSETTCPLTLAHDTLPSFLKTLQLANPRSEEDGTAIGDAIALAAARLEKAEEVMQKSNEDEGSDYELKSKVMILLTDGQQTAGKRDPLSSAELANEWGIKIYTIAVAGKPQSGGLGGLFQGLMRGGGADTQTLQSIANKTGGKFYEAQNAQSLTKIYQEIDELEKSEIQSIQFTDYKELFVPFALIALLLLSAEALLNSTIFRKIP